MPWLILALIAYYLYTQGALPLALPGQRPMPVDVIDMPLPGGIVLGTPLPSGWRAWRLPDGSQVIVRPGMATAPGGWLLAEHRGQRVWFNEQTGQIRPAD